jgi:hypothetical protein
MAAGTACDIQGLSAGASEPSSFSVDQIIEKFMNATTPKGSDVSCQRDERPVRPLGTPATASEGS